MRAADASRYGWKEIPGSSHDRLRSALLALPRGGSLLDLGAGAGHLGRAVAGHFAHVAGVEPDPAVRPPEGVYDEWVVDPVDRVETWSRSFDVVVCADVLEHLADPGAVLRRVRNWIAPGGRLFVSVPNVANVVIRFSLLAGRFEYAEAGILDRTHLRFFTRTTVRRLVEDTGFRIVGLRPTPIPGELAMPLLRRPPFRALSRALFASAARLWPTLFGYQFLIEARPDPDRS